MSDDSQTKPHDGLFRHVFSDPEHAVGELKIALPEALVKLVDWSTLHSLDVSVVDSELRDLASDLVFQVDLAGNEAWIYVLVEHQSSVDPLMGFRLLRYMVRLWQRWLKTHGDAQRLPAILPLVVHHSRSGWTAPTAFHELLALPAAALAASEAHLPSFTYLVDDLSTQQVDELAERSMTALGRLVLICLARARDSDGVLADLNDVSELMREVLDAPNGVAAFAAIVSYILRVTDVEPERLGDFSRQLGPKATEAYMTGAQQLEERGRAKGQLMLLIAQAEHRFAPLSAEQRAKLEAVTPDQALTLAERILDAATFDDLFAG